MIATPTPTPIRTLLVDDEILARLALRQAIASHTEFEIVGECGSVDEALLAIEALRPGLLFLDIRMPGMDGFKLLHGLSPDTLPLVVFATAYDQHALQAFDAGAIDYVLKPIDQARFDQAMERVKRHWQGLHTQLPETRPASAADAFVRRLSVRVSEHTRIVLVEDIDWIHADGNYVHLHVAGERYLRRETFSGLLASLDPSQFVRIHRGTAVNVDRIHEIHPLFNRNAEVVLRDGTRLRLSRRFHTDARRVLES